MRQPDLGELVLGSEDQREVRQDSAQEQAGIVVAVRGASVDHDVRALVETGGCDILDTQELRVLRTQ